MRRWHAESQVYVGAFQYLLHKQKLADQNRNEGNDKSMELQQLMILAKNLLCEIETAINNTRQLMPVVLSRKAMDDRLTFRNNNSNRLENRDVDDLDNKFTKVRFHEYLHHMSHVMRRPGKKNLRQRKKKQNLLRNSRLNGDGSGGIDFNTGLGIGGAHSDKNKGENNRGNGAIAAGLWSIESQQRNAIGGNRNRPKKRHRIGHRRHQNQPLGVIGNNNISNSNNNNNNNVNWTAINANAMKRNNNNNNPRKNYRNRGGRRRKDDMLEDRPRKRKHRRRPADATTTVANLPVLFMNNSE